MKIADLSWMDIEAYLQKDDRAILPLGSVEQHAQLSLNTDSILAERIAIEAAQPLDIPVFPVLAYGLTPNFMAYPGTVTLRFQTYLALLQDILDSLYATGFRRIFIVNGHGGNMPAQQFCAEWMMDNTGARVRFHNWWLAPKTWSYVQSLDKDASHASWMENFPWTRLSQYPAPKGHKNPVDNAATKDRPPAAVRRILGDGVYGGDYQRDDAETDMLWQIGVRETRAALQRPWDI
ncbi:MAG: creatininase family protein [Paracoccaceae bacterium]